ncbi:unnamed protein product [Mytilus coruscus]|uniref:Uncharacterized protein n=1 Tax=Mytilus coruscus TaxID=42192 RepID=A0A6J8D8Y9_MYTCO|nr:unnamed protein product [Mytilus coruscus]
MIASSDTSADRESICEFFLPAKPSQFFEHQRLNLSKLIFDEKHFSSKDEQTKAEDTYKRLMRKEKELRDMKVPVAPMPSSLTLKDFVDEVNTNSLTIALNKYFNDGRNDTTASEYLTLARTAGELDERKYQNTLVCSTCVTTGHTGHEMSEIKRKAEEIKKIAKSKLSNMKEKLQRLSKLVEKTKSVHIPHLDEESEDAITSIRTLKTKLDNIIQTTTEIKINEIEDSQHLKKEELQITYHNMERTFKKQTAVYESLETLLSEEHAVSFLVSYQTLERDLCDLTGDILEDAKPNKMRPPDLVAFLDDIVFSIQEYKKRYVKINIPSITK